MKKGLVFRIALFSRLVTVAFYFRYDVLESIAYYWGDGGLVVDLRKSRLILSLSLVHRVEMELTDREVDSLVRVLAEMTEDAVRVDVEER